MSLFLACLNACGLDEFEAAEFFGTEVEQIDAWLADPTRVPDEAWIMLGDLRAKIDNAANCCAKCLAESGYDATTNPADILSINVGADRMPAGSAALAGALAALQVKQGSAPLMRMLVGASS